MSNVSYVRNAKVRNSEHLANFFFRNIKIIIPLELHRREALLGEESKSAVTLSAQMNAGEIFDPMLL